MSREEREILEDLALSGGWLRPMDLGGRDGSYHSAALARMVKRGWVERENRHAWGIRPAYRYRITKDGRGALGVIAG